MMLLRRCRHRLTGIVVGLRHAVRGFLWARSATAHATGTGADLLRGRAPLLAEHALLRQQLIALRRGAVRPAMTAPGRAVMVLRASRIRAWREALLVVPPATVLRRHRAGFRARWRRKSRPGPGRPPRAAETVALIRRMAADNPRRGAERIRGELLKPGLMVGKRTSQTHLRGSRAPRPRGQARATFLRNHAAAIWAGDFLPVTDLTCRTLSACFVIARGSRRVVHVGVTRHPTDARVTQQRREATPFDQRPRHLIRDNAATYGPRFTRLATASGIRVLRTPVRALRANAVCERFLGRVRREGLDHLRIFGERRLLRVLRESVAFCNRARPHQGLGQATPEALPAETKHGEGLVRAVPVLGGLHHRYERAA